VSLNLVPVDFVIEAMIALAQDERSIGKTLQLADPQPLTTHELFNEIAREVNQDWLANYLARAVGPILSFSARLHRRSRACLIMPCPISFSSKRMTQSNQKSCWTRTAFTVRRFPATSSKIVEFAARHPEL